MFRTLALACAVAAVTAASAGATTPGGDVRLQAAPVGYQIFCLRFKSECQGGDATSVTYTQKTAAILSRVNDAVNRSIRYDADKGEVWKIGVSAGDCEDFALTKRSRLIRAGIPAGALRMATARTKTGEMHAVLIVRTDKGDLVLDNIRKTIVPRSRSGYRYLTIATSDPAVWQKAKAGRER